VCSETRVRCGFEAFELLGGERREDVILERCFPEVHVRNMAACTSVRLPAKMRISCQEFFLARQTHRGVG